MALACAWQAGGIWTCVMGFFGEAGAAEQCVTLHVELGGWRPEIGGKVLFLLS